MSVQDVPFESENSTPSPQISRTLKRPKLAQTMFEAAELLSELPSSLQHMLDDEQGDGMLIGTLNYLREEKYEENRGQTATLHLLPHHFCIRKVLPLTSALHLITTSSADAVKSGCVTDAPAHRPAYHPSSAIASECSEAKCRCRPATTTKPSSHALPQS